MGLEITPSPFISLSNGRFQPSAVLQQAANAENGTTVELRELLNKVSCY